MCLIRRTSRSKHSLLLRDTKRGATRWLQSDEVGDVGVEWAAEAGRLQVNLDTSQFVLHPKPSHGDVKSAAAAAPHAQVLPQ